MFHTHPSRARNNKSSTFSLVHQWCPRFSCKYSRLKSTKTRTNRNSEPKRSRGYTMPEKGRTTKDREKMLLTRKRFWSSKFRFFGFIHSNLPLEWIVRFKFSLDCGWGPASHRVLKRARLTFTANANGKSHIQVENFQKNWEEWQIKQLKTILIYKTGVKQLTFL